MSEHTPGPWRVEYPENEDGGFNIMAGEDDCVAEVQEYDQAEPDARLIAAAPDLLDAASKAARWIVESGFIDPIEHDHLLGDQCVHCEAVALLATLDVATRKAEGHES